MGFTAEDIPLTKCLRVGKGYGTASLCKVFPDITQTIEYWWNKMFQYQAIRLIVGKCLSAKPIIYKHGNMTLGWRHR